MSVLDTLTKSLVHTYTEKLSEQEQQLLLECLEVLAADQKYNKFNNYFPDEGELRRELYKKHVSFFNAGKDYKERAFLAANRVGKCLTLNNEIELSDGSKKSLLALFSEAKEFEVNAYDNGVVKGKAGVPFFKGKEECVRLHTSDDKYIDCALKHRILLKDGYHFVFEIIRFFDGSYDKPYWSRYLDYLKYSMFSGLKEANDIYNICMSDLAKKYLSRELLSEADGRCVLGKLLETVCHNPEEVYDEPSFISSSVTACSTCHFFGRCIGCLYSIAYNAENDNLKEFKRLLINAFEFLKSQAKAVDCKTSFFRGIDIVAWNYIGEVDVYDFEVEKYHNYISNNIVHHNSDAGAYEVTCHATGLYPHWWTGKRYNYPVLIWAGGDTATTVRDIIQKKLIGDDILDMGSGMLPKDTILKDRCKTRRNVPDALEIIKVKHVTGGESTIVLKTYEQGRATWQGTEVDFIWVDEECPQDVYGEALIRLMTTGGCIITTFTPLQGVTPLVLSFLDNSQETSAEYPRWVEICTWDDVPHLSKEEKDKTLANTPPQLREARSRGVPTVGSGLIYQIDHTHITVPDFPIPRHFQRLYGMDVGWKATAACWGAWDRENDVIYIYSEYKRGGEEGVDMPLVHATTIKSRGEWIKGTIDPASRGRTQTDGEQLYMTYKKHGLKIYPAQNAVESGIFDVWERLNSGRLKIFTSCTMLLREISLYHRDEKGRIVKTNDHLCLSKDTSVLTSEGFKKIIDCVGEETNLISYSGSIIKTNGAFKTQDSAVLVEIKTSKGILKCTDNHLLLSTDGLWYDASISEGIEISHLGEELCHYWSCQASSKNSMEKHIGCVGGISSVTVEDYTLLYGNIISAKSQKAMLSTTLTVIDIITKSKTLPALLEESIQHSTIKNVLQKGLNLSFQKPLERLLLHGTNQMEARNGIESITKTLSICFTDVLSENVPFAVKYTKLLESIRQHLFVQTTANQLGEEQAVLTIFNAFVQFVAVNLLPTNILLAKHVQELAEENLQKEKILGVKRIGSEEVYCFNVAGYESFVVDGGMIVHNCDCLRYLCAAEPSMWSYPQQENRQSKVVDMSQYMKACV